MIVGWTSAGLAMLTFAIGILSRMDKLPTGWDRNEIGRWLIGAWVLGPPIWFFLDWTYLSPGLTDTDRGDRKHTHDLARNVWLAFIATLVASFWPELSPFSR